MDYSDIVGGYGQQYDIMGQACPPYGYGDGGFPVNNGGNPYFYPPQCGPGGPPEGAMMVPAGPPAQPAVAGWGPGVGPGGWGPAGWCGYGPPQWPLAVQQNQEPLVSLRPRCPTRSRTEFIGFPRTCIGPCETVTIECTAQVLTKVIRFMIPSSVAFQLLVDQITVGKETLINCGSVSAAMFIEDATDVETIGTETLQPGTTIKFQITNISNANVDLVISGKCRIFW
jgi:hypothetical protein